MKLIFISNYFNHHQKPFCEEMARLLGNDFSFIAAGVMGTERKKLGYAQEEHPAYVCSVYGNDRLKKDVAEKIMAADVVIAGAASEELLADRVRSGKLIFRYMERPFKVEPSLLRKWYYSIRFRAKDRGNQNIYVLCASAFASEDFKGMGIYRDKMYRWGYFPAVKEYDTDALWAQKKPTALLWCGRFLDWKHPDDAVKLAARLKKDGYEFTLNIIGTGYMEENLHQLAAGFGLADCVRFPGAMPPERVRTYMEEAGIYLLTSDRKEGWGAVLNESMNSCCAVVASYDVGAVPFLIENGENGYHYPSGDTDALYEKVKYLLEHPSEQNRLGNNAYHTIKDMWNARVAAERLLRLSERILSGETHPDLFDSGPCSIPDTM